MTAEPFDAVVLAGGTGRRLGGASKPDVELAGRRLLDHALAAVAGARRVVVVAPDGVEVPGGVLRTLEDPPLGGPVAGIGAGLAALDRAAGERGPDGHGGTGAAPWVVVLACDTPRAGTALPRLRAAAPGADGACLVDAGGGAQWLTGIYRTDALRAVLGATDSRAAAAGSAAGGDPGPGTSLRGRSVRSVLGRLSLRTVPARGDEAADVDTWTDLEALARARPTRSADPGGAHRRSGP